jgi:hypothetical protein
MSCLLCHQPGGGSRCRCAAVLHVGCLADLLDNNYWRCQVCCAEYKPEAVLAAAMYMYIKQPSVDRLLVVCMKLTEAGRARESARVLGSIPPERMTGRLRVLLRVELGFAQLALGEYRKARQVLTDASTDLVDCKFLNFDQINIRVMYLYGRCLLGLRRYGEAEGVFLETLKLVSKMSPEQAILIMRAISDLCVARGRKHQYKEAIATIAEITDAEAKDPVARAHVHAELGIAEFDIGLDSAGRLRGALRALRKRGDVKIINAAQVCLHRQVQPKRRLRRKTRIECV